MSLALPLALLSLALPSGDPYGKVGDLKEPDWGAATVSNETDAYGKVDDLKVPDWAVDNETPAAATADNNQLYAKLEDLKDPYAGP
jgi:hypothetical protein